MNAYSKLLLIGVSAITLASVACGKKSGSNGDTGGTAGFNCVQVGATCVPVPGGYIAKGTWDGDIGNDDLGGVSVKIRLSPVNNGPGGWGGGQYGGGYGGQYGGGGFYGQQGINVANQTVQTMAILEMRVRGELIRGQALAVGSTSNFTATIPTRNGQVVIINGNFPTNRQTQMNVNVQIAGSLSVGGQIYRRDNFQSGWGSQQVGYGGGGISYTQEVFSGWNPGY